MGKKDNIFTESAMAGLAAKEDYTAVKLKRSDSMTHLDDFPPFLDNMLISIKGRRYCQVRMIEPIIDSINNSDCFILIAPNRLFLWIGEYANIIEKSKATEIYDWIRLKRDLGIKAQTICSVINSKCSFEQDENSFTATENEFFNILKQNSSSATNLASKLKAIQCSDEDEKYESLINDTNIVYKVMLLDEANRQGCLNYNDENNHELINYCLQPVNNYWGRILSYNMLDENDVFVFDFGAEVYIWSGRNAKRMLKKSGSLLAKKLFDNGFDYSDCKFTPLKPNVNGEVDNIYFKMLGSRPKWTLFGRQKQNAETCLFKSKFIDWPNQSNNPSLKKINYNGALKTCEVEQQVLNKITADNQESKNLFNFEALNEQDLKQLIKQRDEVQVNLILETSSLGRGRHWFDEIERRKYDIVTENVIMWQIKNNELIECDKSTLGELNSNFTYVVKWHYKVNAVGFRALKGGLSQHQGITGRDRYALFFWHGENSSQLEKGSGALLSLELSASISNITGSGSSNESESLSNMFGNDKRSMPHLQVYQNKELAAFCQLFDGSMIIVAKPESNTWRMFEIRGELQEESHLIEIPNLSPDNLRSRTSFLFINSNKKTIFIWHGCASSELHRKLMKTCASNLLKRNYLFKFASNETQIKEVEEGFENESFMLNEIFNVSEKSFYTMYYSFVEFNKTSVSISESNGTPRLFLMTTLYGKFEVKEILNPLRSENVCPFPFFQFHLYEEKQPSLFMIECENEIFIWQGWFEMSNAVTENTNKIILNEIDATDGSSKIRFTLNRKCALQTAINYWNAKMPNKEFKGHVVYAGLEPIEFTNLFPFWIVNENARNSNLNEGKVLNQKDCIKQILTQLNRNRYPAEILRQRPLPDGVNPLCLTDYLSEEEFEEILHCTKEQFVTLPAWKQTNLKKKANLF